LVGWSEIERRLQVQMERQSGEARREASARKGGTGRGEDGSCRKG